MICYRNTNSTKRFKSGFFYPRFWLPGARSSPPVGLRCRCCSAEDCGRRLSRRAAASAFCSNLPALNRTTAPGPPPGPPSSWTRPRPHPEENTKSSTTGRLNTEISFLFLNLSWRHLPSFDYKLILLILKLKGAPPPVYLHRWEHGAGRVLTGKHLNVCVGTERIYRSIKLLQVDLKQKFFC